MEITKSLKFRVCCVFIYEAHVSNLFTYRIKSILK